MSLPKTASEFQDELKRLINDAMWAGVSAAAVAAILAAESETVKSK